MINSIKGKEMISRITPMYANSEIEKAIYEAIGTEWDESDKLPEEVLLQLFPQTATWGLVWWEQRLKLATNLKENIEVRRGKVIAKLQSNYILNPEKMALIIKSYTGSYVGIIEGVAPYTFEIVIKIEEAKDIISFINIAKKLKPSHLAYRLNAQANTSINSSTEARKSFNSYHQTNDMDCGVFHGEPVSLGRLVKLDTRITAPITTILSNYPVCGGFACGEVIA